MIILSIDHSEAMENFREEMIKNKNRNYKQIIVEFIDRAFSLKYEDKWI